MRDWRMEYILHYFAMADVANKRTLEAIAKGELEPDTTKYPELARLLPIQGESALLNPS
jgi:hypothetical protein